MQFIRVFTFKDGSVRINSEPTPLCLFDCADRDFKSTVTVYQLIMPLFHSIEVYIECEVRRRTIFVEIFFEQKSIRAEINEFSALNHSSDDLIYFRMHQRFAACNRDHRCAAFVYRPEGIL